MNFINSEKIFFIECNKSQLNSVTIIDGQLIYVKDNYELYWDNDNVRKQISDIIVLNTEEEKNDILAPLNKFYYVKDSNKLYYYFLKWINIGSSSDTYTKEEIDNLLSTSSLNFTNVSITKNSNIYTETYDNYTITSQKLSNGTWEETIQFSNGENWVRTSVPLGNGNWNISVVKNT